MRPSAGYPRAVIDIQRCACGTPGRLCATAGFFQIPIKRRASCWPTATGTLPPTHSMGDARIASHSDWCEGRRRAFRSKTRHARCQQLRACAEASAHGDGRHILVELRAGAASSASTADLSHQPVCGCTCGHYCREADESMPYVGAYTRERTHRSGSLHNVIIMKSNPCSLSSHRTCGCASCLRGRATAHYESQCASSR